MIMQSAPIIEVKNVSKKYNITHERGRYISIRDVITNIIKSPFAFLKTRMNLPEEKTFFSMAQSSE